MQPIIETVQLAAKKQCKKPKAFVLIKYLDREHNLKHEKRVNLTLFLNPLNTFTITVIVNLLINPTSTRNKNNTLVYRQECNLG